MRDISPVVFRGEPDGVLRAKGGSQRPYFFTEDFGHAQSYARGTEPVVGVLQGTNCIDLTDLDPKDPVHRRVMTRLQSAYPDWICRYSGEPRDAWSFVEAGDLYDYEGTGCGDRWHHFLELALDEADVVRAFDCTDSDGKDKKALNIWVTRERENIRPVTVGEQLSAYLQAKPWPAVQRWLEREHPSVLTRIQRLTIRDEEYRLDQVHTAVPASNLAKMGIPSASMMEVYRALPAGADIRPGDWVATRHRYAAEHLRTPEAGQFEVKSLPRVLLSDVYWAGTDENEFFYLPEAWRLDAAGPQEYLRQLTPEMVRMLCDGEGANLTRHREAISRIRKHVVDAFDHESLGEFHGQDHWRRVCEHAQAVSRSLGVDPLVGYVFAWVHDSQRENEGIDPEHGPRAADYIQAHRSDLFSFLTDAQRRTLQQACRLHSNGVTEGEPEAMVCWDADRLDLWRVGSVPDARWLCTDYAKTPLAIYAARELYEQHGFETSEDGNYLASQRP